MSSSSSQRTNIPKQLPLAAVQPHKAQTHIFQVTFGFTNVPVQFPYFQLPPGSVIRALPSSRNGANKQIVLVSDMYEKAAQVVGLLPGCALVQPGVDVQLELAVDNLNEIWASGTEVEGLTLIVTVSALS